MLTALVAAALQWVILGPAGVSVVRAVVEQPDAKCPAATIDGAQVALAIRYAGGPGFPVTICELHLASSVRAASLRGQPLPLPKEDAARIVALGDTGCRVKPADDGGGKLEVQDCDGGGWPLARIAEAAAAQKPDLVIHLGDVVYRKAPCPAGDQRCASTPAYGASWDAWKAELLAPAEPLLRAAPWVAVRGDHENCNTTKPRPAQGGLPFLLLFDPRPLDELAQAVLIDPYLRSLQPGAIADARAACREGYEPYVVPAGPALDLWLLDSNEPEDEAGAFDEELANIYALQLRKLAQTTDSAGKDRAWLLSHRPVFGASSGSRTRKGRTWLVAREVNVTLQRAYESAGRRTEVDLILSGHLHAFQALAFVNGERPAQIVAGTGGTALDRQLARVPDLMNLSKRPYLVGAQPGKKARVRGLTLPAFGFVFLEKRGDGAWSAAFISETGKPLVRCGAEERLRSLACARVDR